MWQGCGVKCEWQHLTLEAPNPLRFGSSFCSLNCTQLGCRKDSQVTKTHFNLELSSDRHAANELAKKRMKLIVQLVPSPHCFVSLPHKLVDLLLSKPTVRLSVSLRIQLNYTPPKPTSWDSNWNSCLRPHFLSLNSPNKHSVLFACECRKEEL